MEWIFSIGKIKSWIKKVQNIAEAAETAGDATQATVTSYSLAVGTVSGEATLTSALAVTRFTGKAVTLPNGDDAGRPATPVSGMMRINTQGGPAAHVLEVYINGAWEVVALVP